MSDEHPTTTAPVPDDHLPFLYSIHYKYSWGWGPAREINRYFRTAQQAFDAMPRYRVIHRDTREVVTEVFDATAYRQLQEDFEAARAKLQTAQEDLANEIAYSARLKRMVKVAEARAQAWKANHDAAVECLIELQSQELRHDRTEEP